MVSSAVNFSGLLCLFLALGPATVFSAPQFPAPPVPGIINHSEATSQDGNSDFTAGSGVNVGIPDGPNVIAGNGVHEFHRGPCGPRSGDDHTAGAGVNVGIPGGPHVVAGAGEHYHHDGYPCPEPTTSADIIVPTYTPVPVYTTPIWIPQTTPAVYVPAVPIVKPSGPLIPRPAPSASPSPSSVPVYNAGSSLAPASVLAIAVPVILAFFH